MKKDIFDNYALIVSKQFLVPFEILFTKTKVSHVVSARQLLFFLARKRNIKLSEIKYYMKLNGLPVEHSTIIHGEKKIKERIKNDKDYENFVNKIISGKTKNTNQKIFNKDVFQQDLFDENFQTKKPENNNKLKSSDFSELAELLIKLNELKEKGILSEEEFNEKKKKLLKD